MERRSYGLQCQTLHRSLPASTARKHPYEFNVVDSHGQGSDVPTEVGLVRAHAEQFWPDAVPAATSDSCG